ncbi:MAG: type II toxin-antitoxin system death-on-curing family toxin [Saprospiraceae bacterium]|jgi:death-on-curing protein|nr:type II toxin-antitoxin system death-on-curing family toxin [Saprospiraceae bacterium]
MKYLTKEFIVTVNKKTVKAHGGNYIEPANFLNESNLDYLLEIVSAELFGEPLYPDLSDKAGLYMYNIIANHIFQDGNKRTGLEAAIVFLRINGFNISQNLELDEIYNFTINVASGMISLEECQSWFEANIVMDYLS